MSEPQRSRSQEFDDPQVRQAFATLIDDNSPLIQYQVAQSLKKVYLARTTAVILQVGKNISQVKLFRLRNRKP